MKKRKLLAAFFLLLAACVLALCIAAIRRARLLPSETGISVPIFMYHAVGNDCWGEESLFVKPEELEKQLQYLSENGYETIFFEDLAHIEQYEKPVMLTFDDGYDDNSTNLLPLLQKYGMKATIFLIAGGWSHRNMANLPPSELLLEMARSQSAIAALTGRPPTALSYPNGSSNERVRKIAGWFYTYGVRTYAGVYVTGRDPLLIERITVSRGTPLEAFKAACQTADVSE